MKVPADFVCEHGMPQPWATCTDCMLLPRHLQPEPPPPKPDPKPAKPPQAATRKGSSKTRSAKPKASRPRVSTRLPKTDTDPIPALFGDKDLAYEIPDANLRYHVQGSDSNWLSISSMRRELRDGGWVYLQTGSKLVARCRVKTIGFRQRRWTHEQPGDTSDAGPGGTLELYADGWEFVSIDLGADGERAIQGYRYLVTDADGTVRTASTVD